MRPVLTLILVINVTMSSAQTDTLVYITSVDGAEVGTLTATKKQEGSKTVYDINSEAEVNLFGQTTINTSTTVVFDNDKLLRTGLATPRIIRVTGNWTCLKTILTNHPTSLILKKSHHYTYTYR